MNDQSADQVQSTFGDKVFGNLFVTYIEPNLISRIESGELPNPFSLTELRAVQIVFSPEGGRPQVRINSEVRAVAEIRPKEGVEITVGDPVELDLIEKIGVIGLTQEEADFGHATFIQNSDEGWTGYFDFTYYKGTARRHLEVAREFLEVARVCRSKNLWVAFADTLFSAVELAAKASLYCIDDGRRLAKSKKHQFVKAQFNKQHHLGNIDSAHSGALNHLWSVRQTGRYVEDDVIFTEEEANDLLASAESLIDQAHERASTFRKRDGVEGES